MIPAEGTRFETINGSGKVYFDSTGGPFVNWSADSLRITYECHRLFCRPCKTTKSGIRWEFYAQRIGHNLTIHVPETCVDAALEEWEAQHDNN